MKAKVVIGKEGAVTHMSPDGKMFGHSGRFGQCSRFCLWSDLIIA